MVICCAIFAKIKNSMHTAVDQNVFTKSMLDPDTRRMVDAIGLDEQLIMKMYDQIYSFLDDPIRVHAVWKIV